jgi:hypothetical protein
MLCAIPRLHSDFWVSLENLNPNDVLRLESTQEKGAKTGIVGYYPLNLAPSSCRIKRPLLN